MSLRRFVSVLFPLCLFLTSQLVAQQPRPKTSRPAAKSATAGQSTVKAIFEPVNYGQDINLTDVFFVGPDVGWVSGEHATILKTTDGGKTWTPQLGGDPGNNDPKITQLYFLDQNHGWAIRDNKLIRTLDGQNWEEVNGSFPPGVPVLDYAFTSVRHGIMLGGNADAIYITNDGGRHWNKVLPCLLTVEGIAEKQGCYFLKLQMLSDRSGFAVAYWRSPEDPNANAVALLRTQDAGQHWTAIVPQVRKDCCGPEIFFTDMNHGVLVFNTGKTYVTSDGGNNWRALLSGGVGLKSGGATPPMRFADPEVGWVVGESPDNSDTHRASFTTDGGQHWKQSRNLPLPPWPRAEQLKLSFPRRDRAYLVGPHGVIYRYRIVPATYSAAKMVEGPLMPAFGAMELSAKADTIRKDIESLRSKLPQASSDAAAAQSAPTSGTATSASGFTQSTDVSAQDSASATDSTAFVQDTTPAAGPLADCCAAALQQLQADTFGLVTQVPSVTTQYKPLNLIVAGVQLAGTLMSQSKGLWSQFRTLKHAPNLQAASQALQQLSTTLTTVQQTSSNGFQNPGGWFAQNAPATFTQDVGGGMAQVLPTLRDRACPTSAASSQGGRYDCAFAASVFRMAGVASKSDPALKIKENHSPTKTKTSSDGEVQQ